MDIKPIKITFKEGEEYLRNHIEAQGGHSYYIKGLIRKDIEEQQKANRVINNPTAPVANTRRNSWDD